MNAPTGCRIRSVCNGHRYQIQTGLFVWTWCTYRDKHPIYQSSEMTPKGVNSERIFVCDKVLRAPEGSKLIVNALGSHSEVALVTLRELTPPTQADLLPEHRGGARLLGLHMRGGVRSQRSQWESHLMMMHLFSITDVFELQISDINLIQGDTN